MDLVQTIDISLNFKGDHATKFATANTAAHCQLVGRWQLSARSSQDAGGVSRCISKILWRNRETSQPQQRKRGGSMKISTALEDRQLLRIVRTNRFISAPRLLIQMIHWIGRRMSVRTFRRRLLATRYWSQRPARCPRLIFEHRLRRREWGKRHKVWGLRQWIYCIFSDESRFSLYHSDGRVRVRRRQGERLIDACVQPNDGNRGPLVTVWGAIHHVGRSELVEWMEPWTGIGTSRSWGIKCCHGRRGCLDVTLCTSKTMLHPIQHVTRQPFWTNRIMRSWTGQLEVQTWTQLSMFGITCQSRSKTWKTPFLRSWTKQCCPPGVGCSSARKGADTVREHASSCQGSSGR